jgi:hypothetical protein
MPRAILTRRVRGFKRKLNGAGTQKPEHGMRNSFLSFAFCLLPSAFCFPFYRLGPGMRDPAEILAVPVHPARLKVTPGRTPEAQIDNRTVSAG